MKDLLKNLPRIPVTPKVYLTLPESPGVYIYYKNSLPIYVGKAINLKRRVSSYFSLDLEPKTASLMKEANELSYIQVTSELEALLLEARLIRAHMPHYNIAAKDDKHPLYIQITKEKFPRIMTIRKTELTKIPNLRIYGPFPSSENVRSVLRMLRKIFPFSDHKIAKRPCLYSHIGLCDPCPNEISNNQDLKSKQIQIKKYKTNIRHIRTILDGKIENVKSDIEKEMQIASKNEDYEKAAALRNKVQSLVYITSPQMPTDYYIENPNLYEDMRRKELSQLKNILINCNLSIVNLTRIECFDIAHLSGTGAAASMVVFTDGEADKSNYRHFRIRQGKRSSDVDSLKEVIARRINHLKDWGIPNLIIVDGGVGQVRAFISILNDKKIEIPVVGIAKHPDRLIVGDNKIKLSGNAYHLIARMRDEAHRFARVYHHKLLSKSLINGTLNR